MATSSMVLAESNSETGHIPSRWRTSDEARLADRYRIKMVKRVLRIVDDVTALTLARIEEGASRVSWGDGRVAEER